MCSRRKGIRRKYWAVLAPRSGRARGVSLRGLGSTPAPFSILLCGLLLDSVTEIFTRRANAPFQPAIAPLPNSKFQEAAMLRVQDGPR